MKKIFYSILAVSALFSVASCNQERLEIPQKGVTAYETFYKTDEDAESALTAAYECLNTRICSVTDAHTFIPYLAIFNLCGDDILAAGTFYGDNDFLASMNEFRYDNQIKPIVNSYNQIYFSIYRCNLVIDNFKNGTTPVQKRCVAEARVLRAFYHMITGILWGTPSLVDHVLEGNVKPYNCDRDPENPKTHEEYLKWCAEECLAAVPDLRERQSTADKNGAVVVTKGFAYGVAGKAFLYAGEYQKSQDALKKVIDSGKYALVPGERLNENFHEVGDANEEKVFECNIAYDPNGSSITSRSWWQHLNMWNWRTDRMEKQPTCDGVKGWGGLAPSEKFTKALIENDGIDSWRRKSTIIHVSEVMDKYQGGGIKDITGLYGNHEWMAFKQIPYPEETIKSKTSARNFVLMRYAEVLLMYAEDCVMTGNKAEGLKYLNMIQERAGSKHISKELTLDEVKNEKMFEMWLECCRWPDMCRWGDFDGVLNAGKNIPSLYDSKWTKLTKAEVESMGGSFRDDRYYVLYSNPNTGETGFKKGKHELLPYPDVEILVNPNFNQNPGW